MCPKLLSVAIGGQERIKNYFDFVTFQLFTLYFPLWSYDYSVAVSLTFCPKNDLLALRDAELAHSHA